MQWATLLADSVHLLARKVVATPKGVMQLMIMCTLAYLTLVQPASS